MLRTLLFLAALNLTAPFLLAQGPLQQLQNLESKIKSTAGGLPDFAPSLYQEAQKSILVLLADYDKTGKLPEESLRLSKAAFENFEFSAQRIKSLMGKSPKLRLMASHNNFTRSYNPKLFLNAEKEYWAAIAFGEKQKFDKIGVPAKKAEAAYQTLLKEAQRSLKAEVRPQLARIRKSVNDDLASLNGDMNDPDVPGQIDGVQARVNLDNFIPKTNIGIDYVFGNWDPPYHGRPTHQAKVGILDKDDNSIEIRWNDWSTGELGNRVLRSTDPNHLIWETIAERGVLENFSYQEYRDSNLEAATNYCYKIETYYPQAAPQYSHFGCAYTRDSTNIDLWRLQLSVTVANVEHAGSDGEVVVSVGELTSAQDYQVSRHTFLDYGQDDFERNSSFTYDLNLANIFELSDIGALQLSCASDDRILIQELTLMVNNGDTLFNRFFGTSRETALHLGSYLVQHDELRASPQWNAFVLASDTDPIHNVPPRGSSPGIGTNINIDHEQIVSRIESLVGHMIHTEPIMKEWVQWGHLSGEAVEITRTSESVYHVNLDLELIVPYFFNQFIDVQFDLALSKECVDDNTIRININSQNFFFNTALDSRVQEKLIDWFDIELDGVSNINEEFEFDLPDFMSCDDLEVLIDDFGNLVICCI